MRQSSSKTKQLFVVCLLALALLPEPALAILPWGSPIGCFQSCAQAPSVPAYSNGRWEWYPNRLSGYGKKWQCVEYVNRYYGEVYGLKIEGGDAKHYFERAALKGLVALPNGQPEPPRTGDILCSEGGPYGHVAIVRRVAADGVHIIQQNWFNDERDLDTVLPLTYRDGLYWVGAFGPKHPIQGWLRAPETPDQQPVVTVSTPPPAQPAGQVASSNYN